MQRHHCSVCQRTFGKLEHLTRHRLVHTAERPFECHICGKAYSRRDTVQRHVRDVHQGVTEIANATRRSTTTGHDSTSTPSRARPASEHHQNPVLSGDHPRLGSRSSNTPITIVSVEQDSPEAPDHAQHADHALWDWIDPTRYLIPDSYDFTNLDFDFTLDPLHRAGQNSPTVTKDALESRQAAAATGVHQAMSGEATNPDRQAAWFSFVDSPVPYQDVPLGQVRSVRDELDEQYRDIAETQLNNYPSNDSLPPTIFLNKCMRQITGKVFPLLPIIHLPSFRPTERNAWLLVSMCAVGSHLVGTEEAHSYGAKMFESLHRAVLSSWPVLFRSRRDVLSLLQAVILGQTYAMLSHNPLHLLTARAFHGTIIFTFQQLMSRLENTSRGADEAGPAGNDPSVHFKQVLHRIGQALCVQDTEMALLCHQDPILRGRDMLGVTRMSDSEYVLPTTQSAAALGTAIHKDCTTLWDYAELTRIIITISEQYGSLMRATAPVFEQQRARLIEWLMECSRRVDMLHGDTLRLTCLWHSAWLYLLADLDMLERAHGRDGPTKALAVEQRARHWARSQEAQDAVCHAQAIHKMLTSMTLAETPPIHVPRCAFHAGLVLHSLATFTDDDAQLIADDHSFDSADVDNHGQVNSEDPRADVRAMIAVGLISKDDWKALRTLCNARQNCREQASSIAALLRRLGPWGISQRLAATLEAMLT
ncbi:hypothetical protein CKM354_001204900 [Cercospora kikuchii]|uniref:C2H2-type domain-containing protein n=1 Tax=Cercospora kikuchii TaxID=84275 RepID=A0A9P3FIN1_9PEZI|nr:uncharacterized protein CKM354_001204900 [Cercospora kikuchii]GIZ49008.1 hypothetical protein CKM354_001204900 [Cercospora kikuchii]